jgi:hypothetical protein
MVLCRRARTGGPERDRRTYDRLATAENSPLEVSEAAGTDAQESKPPAVKSIATNVVLLFMIIMGPAFKTKCVVGQVRCLRLCKFGKIIRGVY